jgi:hypothetical protein
MLVDYKQKLKDVLRLSKHIFQIPSLLFCISSCPITADTNFLLQKLPHFKYHIAVSHTKLRYILLNFSAPKEIQVTGYLLNHKAKTKIHFLKILILIISAQETTTELQPAINKPVSKYFPRANIQHNIAQFTVTP